MFVHLLPSLRMLIVMSVLTGIVYPVVVTGIAQVAFPGAANGSLISVNGKAMGSSLIGQPFDDPKYFWSRPSATSPRPYNAMASSGSNQGPLNPALTDAVKDRIKAIADKTPSISFKACGNTQDNMHKAEHKDIPLVAQATLVKSGVVRVMELQEQGWTYVRP